MPAVIFECSNHNEKAIIKIIFPYRKDWAERVKKIATGAVEPNHEMLVCAGHNCLSAKI